MSFPILTLQMEISRVRTSPQGRERCCLLGHTSTRQQDTAAASQGTSAATLVPHPLTLDPQSFPVVKLLPQSDPYPASAGLAVGFPDWFIVLPVLVTLASVCKVTSIINRKPGCSSQRRDALLSAAW